MQVSVSLVALLVGIYVKMGKHPFIKLNLPAFYIVHVGVKKTPVRIPDDFFVTLSLPAVTCQPLLKSNEHTN